MDRSVEGAINWLQGQMDAKWADHLDLCGRVIRAEKRLDALETPPKNLSDPFPKDGPSIQEQARYEKLGEWLKGVDERLRKVEETGPARCKNVCSTVMEHDGLLEFLETRLTALSETVARNSKRDTAVQPENQAISRSIAYTNIVPPCERLGIRWNRRTGERRRDPGLCSWLSLRRKGAADRRQS